MRQRIDSLAVSDRNAIRCIYANSILPSDRVGLLAKNCLELSYFKNY